MSKEPIIVEAPFIRAVFERDEDRWTHRIELTPKLRPPVVIMRSLEGASDDPCPPSPVLQHVEFQVEPNGAPAAMGIGKSGRCHWSLSCRAMLLDKARTMGGLTFHIACRVGEEFERIGSCYHIVPESTVSEFEKGLHYRSGRVEWMVASDVESIRDANHTLRMDILGVGEQMVPQTVEWGYLIDPRGPYG